MHDRAHRLFRFTLVLIVGLLAAIVPAFADQTSLTVSRGRSQDFQRLSIDFVVDANKTSEKSINDRLGQLRNQSEHTSVHFDSIVDRLSLYVAHANNGLQSIPMRARQQIRIGPLKGSIPLDGQLLLSRSTLDLATELYKVEGSHVLPELLSRYDLKFAPALRLQWINMDLRFSDGLDSSQSGMLPSVGVRLSARSLQDSLPSFSVFAHALKVESLDYLGYGVLVHWPIVKKHPFGIGIQSAFESNQAGFSDAGLKGALTERRLSFILVASLCFASSPCNIRP